MTLVNMKKRHKIILDDIKMKFGIIFTLHMVERRVPRRPRCNLKEERRWRRRSPCTL